jgi:hypothetical protein
MGKPSDGGNKDSNKDWWLRPSPEKKLSLKSTSYPGKGKAGASVTEEGFVRGSSDHLGVMKLSG